MDDHDFAEMLSLCQFMPGPNLVGVAVWVRPRLRGMTGAIAGLTLATLGPPCAMYYLAFRLWNRFRAAPWQRVARRGLIPVTIGLITGGGTVMAHVADANWRRAIVTVVAAALLPAVRISTLWILIAAGTAGAVGLL